MPGRDLAWNRVLEGGKQALDKEQPMDTTIRKFKSADAGELQRVILDSIGHLSPWVAWCSPAFCLEDARSWIESRLNVMARGGGASWAVVDAQTQVILGGVDLRLLSAPYNIGVMDYWVRRQVVNQGIATLAVGHALRAGFSCLGLQRIEFHIPSDNIAGISVALKAGARFDSPKAGPSSRASESVCLNVVAEDRLIDLAPRTRTYFPDTRNRLCPSLQIAV